MNQEWREKASCKGVDANIFVPLGIKIKANRHGRVKETRHGRGTYAVARTFCASCPVVSECLDYAVREVIEYGMFGGKTPRERRALRTTNLPVIT